MTPAFGLPILLDPRLNNVTSKFGLSVHDRETYVRQIHALHYEWYLRARAAKIQKVHAQHAANVTLAEAAREAVANNKVRACFFSTFLNVYVTVAVFVVASGPSVTHK